MQTADELAKQGLSLRLNARYDEAEAALTQALAQDPVHALARLNLALIQLVKGDFAHGWQNYEARFQTKSYTPRPGFFENRWTGQPVFRKRVLLYSEQGQGDTIQFIRYTPILQAMGATVIVVCQRTLLPLFSSCWGIDRLLSEEEDIPPYDFHCPLASVPFALRTTLTTIPTNVPYLFVPPDLPLTSVPVAMRVMG